MRHSAGTLIRKLLSLDHAQAAGRWKDIETAEIYCGIDDELQKEATYALADKLTELSDIQF